METVESTVDVAVPVRTAYDQWTQFESFPEIMSGVESVTQLTEWAPETFAEKAGAALKIDEMQVRADMRKFKDFIQSKGTETGGRRGSVDDSGPAREF
jgi:Polyketide cyclase / dehydrase and lipid transport